MSTHVLKKKSGRNPCGRSPLRSGGSVRKMAGASPCMDRFRACVFCRSDSAASPPGDARRAQTPVQKRRIPFCFPGFTAGRPLDLFFSIHSVGDGRYRSSRVFQFSPVHRVSRTAFLQGKDHSGQSGPCGGLPGRYFSDHPSVFLGKHDLQGG